jgi:hypothetical protein
MPRRRPGRSAAAAVLLAAGWIACTGCATTPYPRRTGLESPGTLPLREGEPQIVRGRPHAFLDASDWIWPGSLMSKLVLWNWKVDRHHISPETEAALVRYLDYNGLKSVKVHLNAVCIGDEWRRLFRNKAVGAGWRYTLGIFSLVHATIMPGRFFGGDHYNPYTNTINLYSDLIPIALHEAGHSADFAPRTWKGTYAFAYQIPFVSLYHEARASNDALGYLREFEPLEIQRSGYNLLYPAYATYLGGGIGEWVPTDYYYPVYFGALALGHAAGRVRSAFLRDEEPVAPEAPVEPGLATPAPGPAAADAAEPPK